MEFHTTPNCGAFYMHGASQFNNRAYHIHKRPFFRELRDCASRFCINNQKPWRCPGIIVFSAAKRTLKGGRTYGDELAAYIRAHNLGTVSTGGWALNPNTRHYIKVWAWNVNVRELNRQ